MHGEVQEWLNWPLSKSGMGLAHRGFESLPLRHEKRRHVSSFFIHKAAWNTAAQYLTFFRACILLHMKKPLSHTPSLGYWVVGAIMLAIGIAIGALYPGSASLSPMQKARDAVTKQYLYESSTGCKDLSDPIKPSERVAVFEKYLRVNERLNRAVIRGCNDRDSLLALAPNGTWQTTTVNISLDARANPAWAKACFVDDILGADDTVRPENASIDEFNLQACTALAKLNILQIGEEQ